MRFKLSFVLLISALIFFSCNGSESGNSVDSETRQDSIKNLPITDTPARINRDEYLKRDTLISQ